LRRRFWWPRFDSVRAIGQKIIGQHRQQDGAQFGLLAVSAGQGHDQAEVPHGVQGAFES